MKHATVVKDGFTVPLIGIPADAGEENVNPAESRLTFCKFDWLAEG